MLLMLQLHEHPWEKPIIYSLVMESWGKSAWDCGVVQDLLLLLEATVVGSA